MGYPVDQWQPSQHAGENRALPRTFRVRAATASSSATRLEPAEGLFFFFLGGAPPGGGWPRTITTAGSLSGGALVGEGNQNRRYLS